MLNEKRVLCVGALPHIKCKASWAAMYKGSYTCVLCADDLYLYVDVPKGTTRLNAVFTLDEKKGYSFSIIENQYVELSTVENPSVISVAGIAEYEGSLYTSTMHLLRDMYDEGYKYVHFEEA